MSDIYSNFATGIPFNFGAPKLPPTPNGLSLLHILLPPMDPMGAGNPLGLPGVTGISGPVRLGGAGADQATVSAAFPPPSAQDAGLGPGVMPAQSDASGSNNDAPVSSPPLPDMSSGAMSGSGGPMGAIGGFSLPNRSYNYQPLPNPGDYYSNLPPYPIPDYRGNAKKEAIATLIGTGLGALALRNVPGGVGLAGQAAAQGTGEALDRMDAVRQAIYQRALQMANQRYQIARQNVVDQNNLTAKQQQLNTQADTNLVRQYGYDTRNQGTARTALQRMIGDFPKLKANLQQDQTLTPEERGQQLSRFVASADSLAKVAGMDSSGLSVPERTINAIPVTAGTSPGGQDFVRDPNTGDLTPVDKDGNPQVGIVRDANNPALAAPRPPVITQTSPWLDVDPKIASALQSQGFTAWPKFATDLSRNPSIAAQRAAAQQFDQHYGTNFASMVDDQKGLPKDPADIAHMADAARAQAQTTAIPIQNKIRQQEADTAQQRLITDTYLRKQGLGIEQQNADTNSSRLVLERSQAAAKIAKDPTSVRSLTADELLKGLGYYSRSGDPIYLLGHDSQGNQTKTVSGYKPAPGDGPIGGALFKIYHDEAVRRNLIPADSGASQVTIPSTTDFGVGAGLTPSLSSLGANNGPGSEGLPPGVVGAVAPGAPKVGFGFGSGTGLTGVTSITSSVPATTPRPAAAPASTPTPSVTTPARLSRSQIDQMTPAQKLARLAHLYGGK